MAMGSFLKSAAVGLMIGMWVVVSAAEEVTKEQIKGLDEQVQDIKKDVLGISTELSRLEEKLTYPPNTQISIFLAMAQADKIRPDAVKIRIDGKDAANYIYSVKELEALQHGGVQRIYAGNIRTGKHVLEVSSFGKTTSNTDYQQNAEFKFTKDVGAKLIAITIAGPSLSNQGVSFKD
jgi:hypothetical protein